MKLLSLILSLIIIVASIILCRQIISNSIANQQNKNDYAELNNVKYGLFSIDEWKRQITAILAEEISKLYLSKENERVLRKHIEVLLNTLIDKVDKKIREGNSGTAGGHLTQSLMNIFINLNDIKKGIPEYADAVIHEMTKAKTEEQIKAVLNKQLDQYANQTFETQDTSKLSSIIFKTGSRDIESARIKLNEEIALKHDLIVREAALLILLSFIIFALSGFGKQQLTPSRYMFLILSLVTLLTAGVTTPMIDMEATISQMSFMLMGHPIHFENQVLYFQSKSILDVFWIMISHPDIQMKLVGVLLITFSIVFPLLKIASTAGYYFDYHHAREDPVIKFFVTSSGKWSMADVMVVAIFMAYIGFNGIITNQLGHLNSTDQEMVILTTNGTSLQPGYYLFLTYTLLALLLSEILTRKSGA
ncbi:MAG: paraquat-inducible protein A [Gallionellaceae bacterium]